MDARMLELLADALEYPGPRTAARARAAAEAVAGDEIGLAHALWDLAVWLEHAAPGEPEERYTTLFDLSPVCTLDVGYHLFGESYARGAFLAGLGAEMRKAGLEPGRELPDHLPNVLRLLARADEDARGILLEDVLGPALAAMGAALRESRASWADLVRALPAALGVVDAVPPARREAVAAEPVPGEPALEARIHA